VTLDGYITIQPGTIEVPNGWLPIVTINGHQQGSTYGKGIDKDAAIQAAIALAFDEAQRWIGDWQVTVLQPQV